MGMPPVNGRVAWRFEQEDFDVDQIVGVEYIKVTDPQQLASLAMKCFDSAFASTVRPGDVVVGGGNFGYGHPHYASMKALREVGIRAVIAESFSPGFHRGETFMGFPLVTCPGILAAVQRWDEVAVDWTRLKLRVARTARELDVMPRSAIDRTMLEQGGLVPYLKARLRT